MEKLNVYQRINEVRKKINYIQKDKSVSTGGGSYKAVTHDQVTGMIRNQLIEHGIVIVPDLVAGTFHQKEEGAKQRLYDAIYTVNFVNIDQPDDKISMNVSAHALDNGDKAPGKAVSYATKYAILKLFSIETGEDDESRYQQDEFDATPVVEKMRNCKTVKELQEAFTVGYKLASDARDKAAQAWIIREKDNCKKTLSTATTEKAQ